MISVVIPLYNKEKQIERTLRSVFAQTYTDYEIVVVNDGSTDGSVAVVESLNDPRIRLVTQKNAGVSAARNRGINEARGEYIALLDGDDEWKPEFLETIAHLIQEYPECGVFATRYSMTDTHDNSIENVLNKIRFKTSGVIDNYFEVAASSHPPITSSSVTIRKDALLSVGGFPEGIKAGEDLLTWAKLAVRYRIAYDMSICVFFLVDDAAKNQDQKDRRPAEFDYVGKEFKNLYHTYKTTKGLRQYVSLWHKMRCRIFISKYDRKNAFKESLMALKYDINKKNIVFAILSLIPPKPANQIINRFS